jgi:hypothetical protein
MSNADEPRDDHGRWTSGGVGSGEDVLAEQRAASMQAPIDPGDPLGEHMPFLHVTDPANAEDVRRVALAAAPVAEKLGFDPARINVSDAGRQFTLNGMLHDEAGHFDPKTGTVTLQSKFATPSFIPELVTHEVEHAKFQAFLDDYKKEYNAVMADPATGVSEWRKDEQGESHHYVGMKADGTLNDDLAQKYPLYQAYTQFQRDNPAEKMAKEDGCTPYSKDWWGAFNSGTATQQQAYHETLAEMAAIKQRSGFSPEAGPPTAKWYEAVNNGQGGYLLSTAPSKSWNDLYKIVNDNWDKRHK